MKKIYLFAILIIASNLNCYYTNPNVENTHTNQTGNPVSDLADLNMVKQEILEINKLRSQAATQIDLVTLLEFYADDIILMQDSQTTLTGLINVTNNSETWFDHEIGKSTIEYVSSEVFGDTSTLTEIGKINYKDQFGKIYRTNFYMAVWKNVAGKWKCIREIRNAGEPVT